MPAPKHINLSKIPLKPGVYQFKDATGALLYIGKAKQLRHRVSSYFHSAAKHSPTKQIMVGKIAKLEYIITSSETEALLLESSLIKRHQPPYNIDLKDDKNFLYIKISLAEEYPRVFTVRRILQDKAKYFGPYTSAFAVRETLHTLRKLFPHRNFPTQPSKHQLEYYVRRYPELMGPADPTDYRRTINRIIRFLNGDYQDIVTELQQEMKKRAADHQFERAALLRDKIQAIERMMEKQKVVSPRQEHYDIISVAREGARAAVNLFAVRQGKLIAKQDFLLTNTAEQSDAEVLQAFIERFYAQHTNTPPAILVPTTLPNAALINKTFKTTVIIPRRGAKRQYLTLGRENALNYLEQQKASWEKDTRKIQQALGAFKELLKLPKPPRRIETYDISNIQGTNAVGSMVVFTDGQPDKQWYRKFKIKTVVGANDFAMLTEMLQRRFQHQKPTPSPTSGERAGERGGWPQPDLVILDGGKGQLNTVREGVTIPCPVIALAKKEEAIFVPGRKTPLHFPADSEALYLIQRMRDEAHRFAITFYRSRHGRATTHSRLDDVPGVGAHTKKKLLKEFGSVRHVRNQSMEALTRLVGATLAKRIKESL
ncbi:MAG: excinuclease ABC subunit UvrC [Candidatus Kerfeldbacteria bacterium]|nr:excinuclease ABC subunit UvrC [Candidatus Kerfeldbacteria bacterium]